MRPLFFLLFLFFAGGSCFSQFNTIWGKGNLKTQMKERNILDSVTRAKYDAAIARDNETVNSKREDKMRTIDSLMMAFENKLEKLVAAAEKKSKKQITLLKLREMSNSISKGSKNEKGRVSYDDFVDHNFVPSSTFLSSPVKKVRITSRFGLRYHPLRKRNLFHNGLDLATSRDPIFNMQAGTVTAAGYNNTAGNYVIVKAADGFAISYCHLSQIMVRKDQFLPARTLIGISGSTGMATGDHLHLTVRNKNGKYINPSLLLQLTKK